MRNAIVGLCLLITFGASAENETEPQEPEQALPEIVVVATRSPRSLLDVAASVTVIDAKQLADQLSFSPLDLTRYEPALSVPRGSTRFGGGSYNIRGVGGNRVAIEIDGVPIADQFNIGSYSNAQRDLVDFDLVERIEILRGPASTLYGSDAIGGVVAYTTIDPDQFGDKTLRLHSGYRSDDNSRFATLSGAWTNNTLGGLLSVTQRQGEQLESAALTGREDQRDYTSDAIFGKVNWDIDPGTRVTFTLDHFERDVQSDIYSVLGAGRFRSTTLLNGDDTQSRHRYSVKLDAETEKSWAESVQLLGYQARAKTRQHTIEERASNNLRRSRTFDYKQDIHGFELNIRAFANGQRWQHRIGYGLDLQRSDTTELRDGLQTDLSGNNPTSEILGELFPVRDFPNSRTTESGVYIHDEISLANGRWSVIPALRFDHYKLNPHIDQTYIDDNPNQTVVSVSDSRWSPKLGVLYRVGENSNLYAQYAQGFRAPPFEDANIGLEIPLFNIRALPNPDLRSETSETIELGWRWHTTSTQISAAAHYTDYDDFIETKVRLGPGPDGVILFQSQNIQAAEIYGFEVNLEQSLRVLGSKLEGVKVSMALAWTEGENKQTNTALDSIDPAALTTALHWQSQRWPMSASLHATLVDRARDIDTSTQQYASAGYATFDLLANYQFGSATMRAGVFNLMDKTFWRWADVRGLATDDPLLPQLSAPGRSAGLSFSYSW